MFTSTAQAQETNTTAAGEPSLLRDAAAPVVMIFIVFYLIAIRPHQIKIKQHQAMMKALVRGDKVVTGGGVIGVITKIEGDDIVVVEIAPDTKIRVMRETISHVLTKTVANDNKADD